MINATFGLPSPSVPDPVGSEADLVHPAMAALKSNRSAIDFRMSISGGQEGGKFPTTLDRGPSW